jgi:hypothetical protein
MGSATTLPLSTLVEDTMGRPAGEAGREYARRWVAARRAAWFKDKSCAKCGATESLELHHLDPSTKIANCIWSWAQARRDAETAKCIVLCYGCHIVETILQLAKFEHGAVSTYMNHGCRCEECVAAASLKRERQRKQSGRKHQPSYMPK